MTKSVLFFLQLYSPMSPQQQESGLTSMKIINQSNRGGGSGGQELNFGIKKIMNNFQV